MTEREGASRTRVGFVGAGIIARRHLKNLLDFDDVTIAAVADPRKDQAQTFAEICGGQAYSDPESMLERERLDALYICVPPFAHGPPESAAVRHSLPFFVEKPIANNLQTAEDLAEAVASAGLVTAVGYHWRYLDIVEHALDLVSESPVRLALGYWVDGIPPPDWWIRQELSGGQMIEQTTHIFDLARLLVGEVTKIYAAGSRVERPAVPLADISDVTVTVAHFATGALGSVVSTCLLKWPHRIGLHLISEGLAIELSEFDMLVNDGQRRPVRQAVGDPFVREDRDFIDAVQGQPSRIRVPYAEALKTQRLVVAASRAAGLGRALELEPAAEVAGEPASGYPEAEFLE
ncbi:MAG TPA: Gfo/Idh/MocA family oxidoreductase [Dehalococcoidia bacterium]|nr:Gfo/Idh/MocA family oxidoreductase [Dehalococcoidia bacterium]